MEGRIIADRFGRSDARSALAHAKVQQASKVWIVSLTLQLVVEWVPHGIRVNAVCPGVIDTPMPRVMDDRDAGEA